MLETYILTQFVPREVYASAIHYIFVFMPLWLPLLLFYIFYHVWLGYVRAHFIRKQGSVLLEIKLPKEISKSPLAMEVFLMSLYQTGASHYIDTFWNGKVRAWFSLELVSTEGQIRFFIWAHKKFKNLIEAQIYAQYPTVEIYEAEDYTSWLYHDPENLPIWGTQFKLTKEDPYPIKTYVDYGLDKDPKEEYKIDPLSAVLEYLGSMRKGEHVWIQILIQAHRKTTIVDDAKLPKPDWKDEAQKIIKKIREDATEMKGEGEFKFPIVHLTKAQQDAISAIERSIGKWGFDTMMRGIYIAEKDSFNPIGITGLIGSVRQYSSNDLNGFKLGWFTDFDYPWEDFMRVRRSGRERRLLDAYRKRSFFWPPYKNLGGQKPFILTTEELATIYHFPGQVAGVPTMGRIASKKAEAPPNLPI